MLEVRLGDQGYVDGGCRHAHALVGTHPVHQGAAEGVVQAVGSVRDDVGVDACEVHGDCVWVDQTGDVDPGRCVRKQLAPPVAHEAVKRHQAPTRRRRGRADVVRVREGQAIGKQRRLERERRIVASLNVASLLDEQVIKVGSRRAEGICG